MSLYDGKTSGCSDALQMRFSVSGILIEVSQSSTRANGRDGVRTYLNKVGAVYFRTDVQVVAEYLMSRAGESTDADAAASFNPGPDERGQSSPSVQNGGRTNCLFLHAATTALLTVVESGLCLILFFFFPPPPPSPSSLHPFSLPSFLTIHLSLHTPVNPPSFFTF